MRFLIDECLHTSLVQVAQQAGFEAHHVVHFGLQGKKDHQIMKRVRDEEFIFVTNNAPDFRKLFAKEPLHAGLIIIVPSVPPEFQRRLFRATLDEIKEHEPVNSVVEVNWDGRVITVDVFDLGGG
jgi:predicted nuclease of predicted toxin-antitoxin system